MNNNPLLHLSDLPNFADFRPEHLNTAIDIRINDCLTIIETLKKLDEPTWHNFMTPLLEVESLLSRSWSIASHLHSVKNTPELREAYQTNLIKLSQYNDKRNQDFQLYQQFKKIEKSNLFPQLSVAQQRAIKLEVQDFELNGVNLTPPQKATLSKINERLATLASQFENNILDNTDQWHYDTTALSILEGLPEHVLIAARHKAEEAGVKGYRLGLDTPTVISVLTYAKNRELRATFYQAYSTRASDQGPFAGIYDNGDIMVELLQLKKEKANLLGFTHYAALSLVQKMADSPQQVFSFLTQLAEKSFAKAKSELDTLTSFAKNHDGRSSLASWDVSYYSELLQKETLSISQEALRPYFPLKTVLEGLFEITQTLFNITLQPLEKTNTWHSTVTAFELLDANHQRCGIMYMDLYARPHKRGGAWMDEYQTYSRIDDQVQLPVAFLTCNFTNPTEGNPSQLTHDEVVTLFHEFGHCIHHLFSKVEVSSVSGINGVEWDAVELPSQFMENFCWEPMVLTKISAHVETGEPLPHSTLQQLIASRHFQTGMQMMRQLEFSLFDMQLHSLENINSLTDIQNCLDEVRKTTSVLPPPAFNRFQNSFSHIFAGGYAAGYYSYKWAEVLSADAFSKFKEAGVLNPELGQAFLNQILSKGGSQPASELFHAFMGRAPSIEALLAQEGIIDE